MTMNLSLIVIPALAIAYLVIVYGALVIARRSDRSRRSQS